MAGDGAAGAAGGAAGAGLDSAAELVDAAAAGVGLGYIRVSLYACFTISTVHTFDTISTKKSFSLISHASTVFVSGSILPGSRPLS